MINRHGACVFMALMLLRFWWECVVGRRADAKVMKIWGYLNHAGINHSLSATSGHIFIWTCASSFVVVIADHPTWKKQDHISTQLASCNRTSCSSRSIVICHLPPAPLPNLVIEAGP
jgi:hypothetical protein